MAEGILSAEELEALLATVEDEADSARAPEKVVREYDFTRPNKLSGEQLRSLQHMHEAIAQAATMALSTYLRVNLEVQILSLAELSFEVFRNSLANPTVINVLSMDPIEENALATVDIKLAFSLIDRMLGGPGKPLERIRSLTTIEQSLLDNIVSRMLAAWREGWSQLVQFDPVVESREMDPQFVQVIPSSEMVLIATFSVNAPGEIEPGEISFCLPFISLDTVMSQLGANFRFADSRRQQSPQQRSQIDKVVGGLAVPMRAELGTTTLAIRDILALQPGDVLVLDQKTNERAKGFVDDRLRMRGKPGKLGRKMGFLVEEVVPYYEAEPQ